MCAFLISLGFADFERNVENNISKNYVKNLLVTSKNVFRDINKNVIFRNIVVTVNLVNGDECNSKCYFFLSVERALDKKDFAFGLIHL